MTDRTMLPDYFVSPVPGVWAIDETGEAIEWKDHQCTALLLAHLQILCRALADQSKRLPSLTAILYIVDALSKGWPIELAHERVSQLFKAAGVHRADTSAQFVQWLHSLQNIESEFRHGAGAQAAFLCELFEQVPRAWTTDPLTTSRVLEWLENTLGDRGNLLPTRLKAEAHAADRAITTLDFAAMQIIDRESVRLRMRTGLNELPQAESLNLLERFPLAALTRQLANNRDDLGAVARLAQAISATLTLPRSPSDPDALPIGGVSDVTNRGQPDRLLMSELAMDSDLLIARIANGQALFLRREQPPQPEPKHRCLIIECGVRMWGSMRLYSAAFALGLCIAQERRGAAQVDVVTVAGDSVWKEDLSSRAGIERFYERLHPYVHPAEALMDLVQRNSLDLDLASQPILVLSEATERDTNFRRLTGDFPKPHLIARIEPAGWVELLQRSSSGDTSLQRMKFGEAVLPPALQGATPDGLPLFFHQSPCPLRFAMHPAGLNVQSYEDGWQSGFWVLTHDRRAMLLEDRKLGAIEAGCIPSGRVLASHIPRLLTWTLVLETAPHKTRVPVHLLVQVDASRGVHISEIARGREDATEVSYCFDRGQLIRVGNYVTFLDSRTGQPLGSAARQGQHLGGTFFADAADTHIQVASLEGDQIRWQSLGKVSVQAGVAARLENGLPIIYSQDFSTRIQLSGDETKNDKTNMHLYTLYSPTVVRVNADATEMLVSVRGVTSATDARLIGNADEAKMLKVSLHRPHVLYAGNHTPAVVTNFEIGKHKHSYQLNNVRTHLSGLSFDGEDLILHAQRKRVAVQVLDAAGVLGFTSKLIHRAKTLASTTMYPCEKPITRIGSPHARWKLRPIKLPNGQAWLDARGLLHLRAADGSELSLTLTQGMMPGWHSSGVTFGPQYFTASQATYTNATPEVIQWLKDFIRQQLYT